MHKRTTHIRFQPYGDIFSQLPDLNRLLSGAPYSSQTVNLSEKSITSCSICDHPVYLTCKNGIALLAVSVDGRTFEQFVVHRIVRIHPHTYFGLISITDQASVEIHLPACGLNQKKLEEPVLFQPLATKLYLEEIYAAYYQVRGGDYHLPGDAHPYYELTYIDHGALDTTVDGKSYPLSKYDLMIYTPGQKHSHWTNSDGHCSYLTVLFKMDDALPEELKNRRFHCRKDIYQVLCRFMKAIQNDGYLNQELAILYLKEVLILLHQFDFKEAADAAANPMQLHYESTLLNEILAYISSNMYASFTVEELCAKFSISRSSLQNLFRANLHTSPKQYISNKKLEKAKQLIQQHKHTISEISDLLGFTSIHYFSRKFKTQFGISPTEYARSINQ